jgi:hypothetical protein
MTNTNDIDKIIKLYNSGITMSKIAKKFNKSTSLISYYLKKNNIDIPKGKNRKNKIDLDAFKNPNSHDIAYLLGLLTSDGSIDKNGYGFQITSKDIEILKYCKEILKSEHKICKIESFDKRTNKIYVRYNIHFASKTMTNDLIQLGLTNNKSFTCDMPKIDDDYFWSFLRGLFDGDGWITDTNNNGKLSIGFSASERIMNKIKIIFNKNNISDNKLQIVSENENGKIFDLKINSYRDVNFLINKMYENIENNYFLKRKYNIAMKLKKPLYEINRSIKCKNVINGEEILLKNVEECTKYFNVSKSMIYAVMCGQRKICKGHTLEYIL